eukprot:jgi/Tetstr1/454070/TSEL_040989.t1
MSCTPQIRKLELTLGAVTSGVSGGLTAGLLFYGQHKGWDPDVSRPVTMFSMSVLAYALDVLFAKRCFQLWSNPDHVSVRGYGAADWGHRVLWFLRSLVSMVFVRHLALSLVDSLVISNVTEIASAKLDEMRLLLQNKWRDVAVTGIVSVITFNMYVNVIRFSWVYSTAPNITITILLSMWLLFVLYYQVGRGGTGPPPPAAPHHRGPDPQWLASAK